MTSESLTDVDLRLRDAIVCELEWDPVVDASAIAVSVSSGSVTLNGCVDRYSRKLAAERAARRIHGMRTLANEIEVRPRLNRADADIAHDALQALACRAAIPASIQATVDRAQITLSGSVNRPLQRQAAENAVRHIRGVRNVVNNIAIVPHAAVRVVQSGVVHAAHESAWEAIDEIC